MRNPMIRPLMKQRHYHTLSSLPNEESHADMVCPGRKSSLTSQTTLTRILPLFLPPT